MIKLLIADDEKIIRETIRTIIDWDSLGIEVVGLCQNGHEAYNMILDCSPDIVLTDLKMPGMDGLELIEKIYNSDRNTQFIILSGYGEFEYAKRAMSFGVREYLLKPCNEEQIIKSIKACIATRNKGLVIPSNQVTDSQRNIISNFIYTAISEAMFEDISVENLEKEYSSYLDFRYTPYRLVYVYYLTYPDLPAFLDDLKRYSQLHFPFVAIYGVYVKNTLLLFFKDYDIGLNSFLDMINTWHDETIGVNLETKSVLYQDLSDLLVPLIGRIRRYDEIYLINDFRPGYLCNYNMVISGIDSLICSIKEGETETLSTALNSITNLSFLKQFGSTLILKISLESSGITSSFLADSLKELSKEPDYTSTCAYIIDTVNEIKQDLSRKKTESSITKQIRKYVNENLSDSNISLKYISENVLFMNVDYVSKKFLKETGQKFSAYLSELRINRAKELLLSRNCTKMQDVADAVGLGNNPQYFSQLFRKATGKTPSAFIAENNL